MARSFNGTSDLVNVDAAHVTPNWFTGTSAFSFWVKASAALNKAVYSEGDVGSTNDFWMLATDTSTGAKVRWTGGSGNAQPGALSTATVFDNTWHHFLLSVESHTYRMYVDGVADTTGNVASTQGGGSTSMATIGALRRGPTPTVGNWLAGTIAEVADWNRGLSASEAIALAAGMPASHLGPLHYWPLWGADSPEPDIGNGTRVTGTLTGTTAATGGKVSTELVTLYG